MNIHRRTSDYTVPIAAQRTSSMVSPASRSPRSSRYAANSAPCSGAIPWMLQRGQRLPRGQAHGRRERAAHVPSNIIKDQWQRDAARRCISFWWPWERAGGGHLLGGLGLGVVVGHEPVRHLGPQPPRRRVLGRGQPVCSEPAAAAKKRMEKSEAKRERRRKTSAAWDVNTKYGTRFWFGSCAERTNTQWVALVDNWGGGSCPSAPF